MEIIGIVIAILIIRAFVKASIKKNQNEKIKAGTLVKLANGEVRDPNKLSSFEKSQLPSYIYLSEHGFQYGYKNLASMSISELQSAMSFVSKKRYEETLKMQNNEEERKLAQIQKQNEELNIAVEKMHKRKLLERLQALLGYIAFELTDSNLGGTKAGVYVILCTETKEYYIGSSANMLKRKFQHLSALRSQKHHSYKLQKAFDQYGEKKFIFCSLNFLSSKSLAMILNPNPTKEEIDLEMKKNIKSAEQSFINELCPAYNVEKDVTGRRHWENFY